MRIRTYSELSQLETLEERYDYLYLHGAVGDMTFGSNRWINQRFYRSAEWRDVRRHVILRDNGKEIGCEDRFIKGTPQIHHMNPINLSDIVDATDNLLNPEYLISTSHWMHNAIHYGLKERLPQPYVERSYGDTAPWLLKKGRS